MTEYGKSPIDAPSQSGRIKEDQGNFQRKLPTRNITRSSFSFIIGKRLCS